MSDDLARLILVRVESQLMLQGKSLVKSCLSVYREVKEISQVLQLLPTVAVGGYV